MESEHRGHMWYEWIPGWMPICAAIFGGALWVGQYTQGVNDRLQRLEDSIKEIRQYLQRDGKGAYVLPPISRAKPLTQYANDPTVE